MLKNSSFSDKLVKSPRDHLLLTNSRVNEIETFLDFFADRRRGRYVIARGVEARFVGRVLDGYELSLGARVRVAALLHQRLGLVFALTHRFYVTAFLRHYVVASFVAAIANFYRQKSQKKRNCFSIKFTVIGRSKILINEFFHIKKQIIFNHMRKA